MKALSKVAMSALTALLTASNSEAGFGYVASKEAAALEERGLAELNREMTEGDTIAARITDAGRELVSKQEGTAAEAKPTVQIGQIVGGVEMPAAKRAPGGRQGKFPFDQLEVGQSFFVPDVAGAEKPMSKTMASTVSTANARYAEEIPGETRLNRRTREQVPATRQTRKFELRHIEDGAAWGFPGQSGAGIWRTL